MVWTSPMPAVVAVLTSSDPISHARRDPRRLGNAASKAPSKYPRKLAEAISPAADLLRPSASIIAGNIGV